MCGIAGIFNFNDEPVSPALLRKMTDVIAHRGPDSEGFYIDSFIGLGHRRLAIIGAGTRIRRWTHVCPGALIGENCNIGQNVFIAGEVIIGNNCKIQNNVSIYKGITLEDGVFCGPSMVFTNIHNPRAEISKMDQVRPTLVTKGATLVSRQL